MTPVNDELKDLIIRIMLSRVQGEPGTMYGAIRERIIGESVALAQETLARIETLSQSPH